MKKLTAQEISNIIANDDDFTFSCSFYGIRSDVKGLQPGHCFDNSHELLDDDPSEWCEDAEYIPELGLWDCGELDGTCALGIQDGNTSEVDRVIAHSARKYYNPRTDALYLIRGTYSEGGEDAGETIIRNSVCVGEIDLTGYKTPTF